MTMSMMSYTHPMTSHHHFPHHQNHLSYHGYHPTLQNHNINSIAEYDTAAAVSASVFSSAADASSATVGHTSYDVVGGGVDSENESNFTSDDFDSEGLDDIDSQDQRFTIQPLPQSRIPPAPLPLIEPESDIADQLLHFAEMVNKDIQKYFGKRKAFIDDKDDNNEFRHKDRFASGKSGRELYYADILKVAKGETMDAAASTITSESKHKTRPNRIIISSEDHMDKKLGPLGELFDFALSTAAVSVNRQNAMTPSHWGEHSEQRRAVIPWRKRSLPTSFFLEPRTDRRMHHLHHHPHGLSQDAPDFSDLMAAAADD